jgi:hypothetical protein
VGALMGRRAVSSFLVVLIVLAYALVLLRGEIAPLLGQIVPLT